MGRSVATRSSGRVSARTWVDGPEHLGRLGQIVPGQPVALLEEAERDQDRHE